jgi:hypothetical protein
MGLRKELVSETDGIVAIMIKQLTLFHISCYVGDV